MRIQTKELKNKEAILYKIISSNALLPILKTYLFDKDTITATDLENSLKFRIDTENKDSFCIEASTLHKFLSKIDSDYIDIEIGNDFINIKSDVTLKIENGFPAIDYPSIPKAKSENIVTTDLEDFKDALKYCYKACSSDRSRPVLNGIHCNVTKNNFEMETTDSYRVHIKNYSNKSDTEQEFDFVFGIGKNIYNIFKMLKYDTIGIFKSKGLISFIGEDFAFTTRLMDYGFPNTDGLLKDSNFNYIYKVDTKDFIKTLKKLIPFDNWNSLDCKPTLNFKSDILTLVMDNREQQISKEIKIEIIKGNENYKIGVNFKYLLEAAENLKDANIYIKIIEELKPIWVIPEHTHFKALIMPIRIL